MSSTCPPEKVETLARELLKKSPKNAQYWFELAGILRTLGKYQEALQAAQNAVNLAPEQSYRPRLANILAKVGQLDTAEQTYREMLHDHQERPKYWFWYAKFLNEYYPDRIKLFRLIRWQQNRPVCWFSVLKHSEFVRVLNLLYTCNVSLSIFRYGTTIG